MGAARAPMETAIEAARNIRVIIVRLLWCIPASAGDPAAIVISDIDRVGRDEQ
jgi:hypothetical protein